MQASFVILAALMTAGLVAPARAGDELSRGAPSGAAAMRIYRDPVTGEVGVPPPGAVGPAAERSAAAPLVETPGTSAAGWWKLGPAGMPRHAFVATHDAAGKATIECLPAAPAGRE